MGMDVLIFVLLCISLAFGIPFKHVIDFEHPESGEKVKLHSSGQLSNAVDLDRIDGIKRVICEGPKILIAAKTTQIAKEWKEGQVVLGSAKWDCHQNTMGSDKKGVYAKIKSIYFPTETGIVLHTEQAGAFDVIEEADIKFHYHPGNESSHVPDVRRRHRRYLANILSQLLNDIEWKANFSTTVPWNYDIEKKAIGPSTKIVTTDNTTEFNIEYDNLHPTEGEEFSFTCNRCHGLSVFSYTFEIVIKKNAMNQPNIHHYLSKLETNTSMHMETSLMSNAAMRVEVSKKLLETAPYVLFTLPVAVVDDARIPPVTLTVNYESQTYAYINMTAADAVTSAHEFNLTGAYEIVQEYSAEHGMQGFVKADNWVVRSENAKTETKNDLQLVTSVFQKININTTIGWLARDMEIDFSPPMEFKITPNVISVSRADDVQRCTVDKISVTGDFNVSDARLIVDAFNVPIWNTLLAEGFNRSVNIREEEVFKFCQADCFPTVLNSPESTTAEEVVGNMKQRITRNDTSFSKLHQIIGNSILFASEEADTASWCGYPGRPCVKCTYKIAGNDDTQKCADRMMTSTLASTTSLLGKYVSAEWPERKLLVHEAWDEATSRNPFGEHGNTSLHYEGRAASLSVSSELPSSNNLMETESKYTQRLEELAVCAGFPFVSRQSDRNLLQVAVKEQKSLHMKRRNGHPETSKDKLAFEAALRKLDQEHLVTTDRCPEISLTPGSHWPTQYKDEIESCGGTSYRIQRENEEHMRTLYEYPASDVHFANEGSFFNDECGLGRACRSCEKPSMSDSTWDWCSTRTMSPRLAFRLKRLAVLAQQDDSLKDGQIKVLKAFDSKLVRNYSPLYNTGRAIKIAYFEADTENHIKAKMDRLASLSVCAGFDFVKYSRYNFIEAFVKEQDGFRTTLNPYPSGEVFVSVAPPLDNYDDFSFPVNLELESRKPALIRTLDTGVKLSKHFTVNDFKDKSQSYMRIDSSLVECLEMTRESFDQNIYALKAYTTKSSNTEMNSEWKQDQLDRFQMGQAAVIQDEEQSTESIIKLAKLLMSKCTPKLRLQRRGLALSIRDNGVCQTESKLSHAKYCMYVGLYTMHKSSERQYIRLSIDVRVNGQKEAKKWEQLREYKWELTAGGPQIVPYDEEKACEDPGFFGERNSHLTFKLYRIGFCLTFGNKKRCDNGTKERLLVANKLWDQLSSTNTRLEKTSMIKAIDSCFVFVCGGCPGAGSTWDTKVRNCVHMIDMYIFLSSKPLVKPTEHVAFFNTENEQSAAHGLACKRNVCVERVQLYNILQTILSSKYKPNPNSSIEEPLFDGHDNASPLLEIVEQHVAKQANGNVTVYIENLRDISAMRNIIKILMIHNRKIHLVTFKTIKNVNKEKLASAIQRKIETWAGSACPKWSRYAVTPYNIEEVPADRVARSIEDGIHRNKLKEKQKNWEIDWIMMT